MAVAGIDIGTSGCKCTVFENNGAVSTYAFEDYAPIMGSCGEMELSPDTVWEHIENVIRRSVAEHSGSPVTAMCVTSFGEGGVLLDRDGRVLYNTMLYTDNRGEEQIAAFTERAGGAEAVLRRSGVKPHSMYSAGKLMWIAENRPDLMARAWKFLQYSGFTLFRLTGEAKEDWSLCSRTLVFNVTEKHFDRGLIEAAGLPYELFPEPICAGTVGGQLLPSMAEGLGLKPGIPVVLAGQDQITAVVGGGATKPGIAVNGMGTVDCITPVFDRPILDKFMGDCGYACVPYLTPDTYVTYAFGYAGGASTKWFKTAIASESKVLAAKNGTNVYAELEKKCPTGPSGILYLPYIMGAATPYMDNSATGAFVGLRVSDGEGELYKAVLEGVACEARLNLDNLLSEGVRIERMRAGGGGSSSRMWLQIKADLFNLPIERLEVLEVGTLGSAIMSLTASGEFSSINEGVDALVRVKDVIEPNRESHERYEEQFLRYKRLYTALKGVGCRE